MDKLSLVSRLFSYHLKQGNHADVALAELRASLPVDYTASIDALEKSLGGDQQVVLVGYETGPLGVLTELAAVIKQERGDTSKLYTETREGLRDAVVQANEYWSGFSALTYYMVVLLAVAMGTISIFVIFVLPQFEEMFASFDPGLPALTKFILANDGMFGLLVTAGALAIVLLVTCSYHIRKRVAQFRPLTNLFKWIPGLGALHRIYRYYLFLHYSSALTRAGVKGDIAVGHGKRLAGVTRKDSDDFAVWREALNAAGKMQALDEELDHQISQIGSLFGRQMIVTRENLTTGTQLFIGLLIGLLVTATYLPIFMMGQVV